MAHVHQGSHGRNGRFALPDRIEEYLNLLCEQIRWKRAVPVLKEELETHLLEQKSACIADGLDDHAAEAEAVRQMGDPLTVGSELDRVHRPKPQWGLILLVSALALIGGYLRFVNAGHDLVKVVFFLLVSFGCLIAGYFLDYSFFGKHAGVISAGVFVAGFLALRLSPRFNINGVSYYGRYVGLLIPLAYALGVFALRGRGWKGFLSALGMAVPFEIIILLLPDLSLAVLFGISAVAALVYSIRQGWFDINRKIAYSLVTLISMAAILRLTVPGFLTQRLALFFHPELEAETRGWQGVVVRDVIQSAVKQWQGGTSDAVAPIPEASSRYFLTDCAARHGLIPFVILCVALVALMVILIVKCMRQRNALGGLVVLSVVLTLGFQVAACIFSNLGYILFTADCPLIAGNLHTVIDMALIGVALSVFRQEKLPERSVLPHTIRHCEPRIMWRDKSLTIRFQ